MKQRMYVTTLALLMTSSMLVAAATVLVLHPEDKISVRRGASLTALGFVFFPSLFELINYIALRTAAGLRARRRYSLTCGDVLDISNKVVSAIQAALCAAAGAVVCAWSCARDLLRTSHYMSEAYAWFGAAYFFYDIWSMYKVHVHMTTDRDYFKDRARKPVRNGSAAGDGTRKPAPAPTFLAYCRHEPVILFHHLFIGGFGFLVIVYLRGGLGDCVFGSVYLMELSTPFVSLRGILSRLRLKSSRLYVINGLAMLGTFLVCRVMSLPYVMLLYSRAINASYIEAIASLPIGCKISICALMLPQLYWFCLMAVGAVKVLKPTPTAAKELVSSVGEKRS